MLQPTPTRMPKLQCNVEASSFEKSYFGKPACFGAALLRRFGREIKGGRWLIPPTYHPACPARTMSCATRDVHLCHDIICRAAQLLRKYSDMSLARSEATWVTRRRPSWGRPEAAGCIRDLQSAAASLWLTCLSAKVAPQLSMAAGVKQSDLTDTRVHMGSATLRLPKSALCGGQEGRPPRSLETDPYRLFCRSALTRGSHVNTTFTTMTFIENRDKAVPDRLFLSGVLHSVISFHREFMS